MLYAELSRTSLYLLSHIKIVPAPEKDANIIYKAFVRPGQQFEFPVRFI